MLCRSCGSQSLGQLAGDVTFQLKGLTNVHEPPVYVSPQLVVCLSCGIVQFAVPEVALRLLAKAHLAAGTISGNKKRLTPISPPETDSKRKRA